MEFTPHGPYLGDSGPIDDVVLSSRVRLARNVAGFPYVNKASDHQQHDLINLAQQVVLQDGLAPGMFWVDLIDASAQDRQLLVERHLISKNHADANMPRGVAISGDESLSIMVNEEDHLRMQVLAPGLQLRTVFERINQIDDAIEEKVDYAFSPRWGYLTACPTNVGTGIRLSVMVHLPGLKLMNEIERVRRAAKDLNLAVRGYYGEGTDSAGDFYQISNQVTLGQTETQLLECFENEILPAIIEYERQARSALLERRTTLLDDRVFRALAVLRSARLLGAQEAMKQLSRVRMGVNLKRIDDVDVSTINCLFLQVQSAHLQQHVGAKLSADETRKARATVVRRALGESA